MRHSERLMRFGSVLHLETCSQAADARLLLEDLRQARSRYGLTDTEATLMSALHNELCAWNYHNALLKELRQLSRCELQSRAERHGIRLDFSAPLEEAIGNAGNARQVARKLSSTKATWVPA